MKMTLKTLEAVTMNTTPPTVLTVTKSQSTIYALMSASSANRTANVALCDKHMGALSVLGVKVGENNV